MLLPETVSFRTLVPCIHKTDYLTHGVLYYPAKFIPHVPRYCIETYTKEQDWILDIFAGSATTGVEAVLTNRNVVLADINPMLNHLVPVKMPHKDTRISIELLDKKINLMFDNKTINYRPDWYNVDYWYHPAILERLLTLWSWTKEQEMDIYRQIIETALLKSSRYFSYADHHTPKLHQSKKKKAFIEKLLSTDWLDKMKTKIRRDAIDVYYRVLSYAQAAACSQSEVLYRGGIDTANDSDLHSLMGNIPPVKAIITSPPYLQAQEYIRASKIDLYWLGYNKETIKKVSHLEIPYRKTENTIATPTLSLVKENIKKQDLLKVLDSYFYYTIKALENAASYLAPGGVLCIFVGSPKMSGVSVPIWKILIEYFEDKGYIPMKVYEDRIKHRKLFRNRNNTNPEGMETEFLVVIRK